MVETFARMPQDIPGSSVNYQQNMKKLAGFLVGVVFIFFLLVLSYELVVIHTTLKGIKTDLWKLKNDNGTGDKKSGDLSSRSGKISLDIPSKLNKVVRISHLPNIK